MKNFLEKDLETIIWENYTECQSKGLVIDQDFYKQGKLYRQMNLMPYGIADLVCLCFLPAQNVYYVQVIELKKDKIDSAAYAQAKRYQSAIVSILKSNMQDNGADYNILCQTILIGTHVESSGDFVFCLNGDASCTAFTYSYGLNGIEFKRVGRDWAITSAKSSSILQQHGCQLSDYECECWQNHWSAEREAEEIKNEHCLAFGDYSKALLVTKEGILFNSHWLSLPEQEETEDAAE